MHFNNGSRFPGKVGDVQAKIRRTRVVVRVMLFQFNGSVLVTVSLALCLQCGIRIRVEPEGCGNAEFRLWVFRM